MCQRLFKTVIILISIFSTLHSFCSTHSINTFSYSPFGPSGGFAVQTTTEPWERVMNKLFGTPLKLEKTNMSWQKPTTSQQMTTKFESEPQSNFNISDIFYYREYVVDYPDLSKYAHSLKNFEHLFDSNELDTKSLLEPDEQEYIHLCGNHKRNISLAREVMNSQDEKVLLVNSEKYSQTIEVEVCGNFEGSACDNNLKHFREGYEPMCKQNYIFRKMVVLKKNDDASGEHEVAEDDIRIPACCECVLKEKFL